MSYNSKLILFVGIFFTIFFSSFPIGATMITVGLNLQEINLDPKTALNFQHFAAIDLIHEPLVYVDEDLKIVGALAESWKIEDHGKRLIFKLRSGVKFHDGRNVTAEDVVATLKGHLSADSQSYLKETLESVLVSGDQAVFVKDHNIYFTLKGAYPSFLELLASIYIVPENYNPKLPVGAGPYKVEMLNDKELVVSRVKNGAISSSNIESFKFILVQTNEFADHLRKRDLDITLQAPLALAIDPPSTYAVFQSKFDLVSVMFYYNLADKYWSNKTHRLFLKSILLKAREKAGFLSPFDKKLSHFIHEGILSREYNESPVAFSDKSLPSEFPKTIRMLAPNTFLTDRALRILTETFKESGVDLKLTLGKGKQLSDPASRGEFDLALFPYESALRDPDGFLFLLTPDAPLIRFFSLPTREYMKELAAQKFNEDRSDRLNRYTDVFKRIEADEVIIPFFTQRMPFLYSAKLLPPSGHSLTPLSLRFFNKTNE